MEGFINTHKHTHVYKEIYYKELLMWLWRLKSPTICKLETQKSQWCSSVQVQRPENLGLMVSVQGQEKNDVSAQSEGQKVNSPTLHLSFYLDPQWFGWSPPTLGRAICFTPPPLQSSSHLETASQTHLDIGHPVSQSSWHKINHRSTFKLCVFNYMQTFNSQKKTTNIRNCN